MNKRVECTIRSDSPELFRVLTETHQTIRHPFIAITPLDLGRAVCAIMPENDADRPMRANTALNRLFDCAIPFHAEIRGIDEVASLAEYQFWGLSDWVGGAHGTEQAGHHFFNKVWEEYLEAQEDITDESEGLSSELADLLFCINALASNEKINLSEGLNYQLNSCLPESAERISDSPISLDEIDEYVSSYENLPIQITTANAESARYYDKISTAYFDFRVGMSQPDTAHQIRLFRTLISSAQDMVSQAMFYLSDDDIDSEDDAVYLKEQTRLELTQAATLVLVLLSYVAQGDSSTLSSVVNANIKKISRRVALGLSPTKMPR